MTGDWTVASLEMAARIAATCALLFGAGRALVYLVLRPATPGATVTHPNLMAVAVAPAWTLLLTWALRAAGVYAFWTMLAALALTVAAGAALSRGFRAWLQAPQREWTYATFIYLTVAAILAVLFSSADYPWPFPQNSAIYLTSGWDLFLDKPATLAPFFGKWVAVPVGYAASGISALFALFSYGQHYAYYQFGIYWLNVFLPSVLLVGAFLFFFRHLRWGWALIAALIFCETILGIKVWNLRGESLAWIAGFPFLAGFQDLLGRVEEKGADAHACRLGALLTVVFFSIAMLHGITGFIVLCICAGLILNSMVAGKLRGQMIRAALLAAGCGSLGLLLLFGFIRTYSTGTHLFEDQSVAQPAGARDAAFDFISAVNGVPNDEEVPRIRPAGPYADVLDIAKVAAVLPIAATVRGDSLQFELKSFPAEAIRRVNRIPTWEILLYLLPILMVGGLASSPWKGALTPGSRSLFWAGAAVYMGCIVLSIRFDVISTAIFPLATMRRLLPYIRFSYCLMLAPAALDLLSPLIGTVWRRLGLWVGSHSTQTKQPEGKLHAIGQWIWREPTRNGVASRPNDPEVHLRGSSGVGDQIRSAAGLSKLGRAAVLMSRGLALRGILRGLNGGQILRGAAIAAVFCGWILLSARPLLPSHGWTSARMAAWLAPITGREPARNTLNDPTDLFEAFDFLRAHTGVGEWVCTNAVSEEIFWFLSNGRLSLIDGQSVYTLGRQLQDGNDVMRQVQAYVQSADLSQVSGHSFRYILLYKRPSARGLVAFSDPVYATNLAAFARDRHLENVFENPSYVIYRRRD